MTCFRRVDYDLSNLLTYIQVGDIGLPDIQRPFVWKNAKVRDLFDSMYKGYPVGYFLFWENAQIDGTRRIGDEATARRVPNRLIVDGQQRLTSLYAVFKGKDVLDDDYRHRKIEIAFNPRTKQFEVADAAIRNDTNWISNISSIWADGSNLYAIIKDYLERIKATGTLNEGEENEIPNTFHNLYNLKSYPFTALEIAATVDEEKVADIFVRINSEGVKLNQADFILTLLSVFWDEGRADLEHFSRSSRLPLGATGGPSPYNHFIDPDPDQMLRVSIGYGFKRGRLKSVYQILRGKDLDTGTFSPEQRDKQFAILADAQKQVLNLTNWHQFLSSLVGAGYRSRELISSQTAILYAYVFYLIGRLRLQTPEDQLQKVIGRWFFFTTLTGRYSSSPESAMDGDLNRLKDITTSQDFIAILDELITSVFTNDYWRITLPAELDTSAPRSPQFYAFIAAQNKLNADVLFSHKKVSDLLDPALQTTRKPLERHHIFPKAWLQRNGVTDQRQFNQNANYALIEWPDNANISDEAPYLYAPRIRARFENHPETWSKMMKDHAMPEGWATMDYQDFLNERRKLMAEVIRRGFERLT